MNYTQFNTKLNEAINYKKLAKQFVDDDWLDAEYALDNLQSLDIGKEKGTIDIDDWFNDKLDQFNREELDYSQEFDNNKTQMSIEVKKLLKGDLKKMFESKITVKRKYTENYPVVTVGKHASIRNKIIEALKDGELTKEAFDILVSGLTEDSKRWLRRNATFFNIQEDKVTLSKTGQRVLNNITENKIKINENTNMENKFIYESFSAFVKNVIDKTYLVSESFKSSILAGFIDLKLAPKDLYKAFYNYTKVALDQIEDEDFIEMTPNDVYKSKELEDAIVFYVSQNEKENIHAPEDAWGSAKTIPANSLLAIANGQNEFFGLSWNYGSSRFNRKNSMKNLGKGNTGNDSVGIGKKYTGWDATGLYNVKRISEVADIAYVLPLDVIRNKYSVEGLKAQRDAAKAGATAMMDAKSFKDANIARYRDILATRLVNDDFDSKIEDAIVYCASLLTKAVSDKQFTRYGELLVATNSKGKEVRMGDITSFMNNLMDDYVGYTRNKNSAKEEGGGTYHEREAKQKAIYMKEKLTKLANLDLAW